MERCAESFAAYSACQFYGFRLDYIIQLCHRCVLYKLDTVVGRLTWEVGSISGRYRPANIPGVFQRGRPNQ